MKVKSESYPEKIRKIAHELSKLRDQYDVDQPVEKLRMIADVLERNLKKPTLKKT